MSEGCVAKRSRNAAKMQTGRKRKVRKNVEEDAMEIDGQLREDKESQNGEPGWLSG